MKLFTPIDIPRSEFSIHFSSSGLILGSCFAEHMGRRMERLRFGVENNPFGVLYNPCSVYSSAESIRSGRKFVMSDLVERDGLWHSWAHHGSFSNADSQEVLSAINRAPVPTFDYLIITLGTAWVYEYQGGVVANCHKFPASEFCRRRLTFAEILEALKGICELYPDAKKIFTVSPIRHVKDGLVENSLSKALLRTAVAEVVQQTERTSYFPAYEIMMDELRDYRFYESDLLHPSAQAVEYIWERFGQTYFDAQTMRYISELSPLLAAVEHRPLHSDSESYERFRQTTQHKIKRFADAYPMVDLSNLFANFA